MAVREVIFRAKRKDNGEWVYGVPLKEGYSQDVEMLWYEYGSLAYTERVKVLPETVGQYTGLTDKNGKKVFEGDIVKVYDNFDCVGETLYVGKVQWDDTFLNWELITNKRTVGQLKDIPSVLYYEVIGNVFDNPELLEVK